MTAVAVPQIGTHLAVMFGMAEGRTFGRGCAGLFALFTALARQHGPGEIVVPAICCETVALAALYAGHELRIADVAPDTLCLSPETLAPHLSQRTRAVLVVHIFGVDAQASRFADLRRHWPETVFIEDIAHATGGRAAGGALLGGALDYTLLSFASDKIVPGNGGALLCARAGAMAAVDAATPTAGRNAHHGALSVQLRDLIHGFADAWRAGHAIQEPAHFRSQWDAFRDLICYGGKIEDETALAHGLAHLEEARVRRLERHKRYEAALPARSLPMSDGSMCWRSTFVFPTAGAAQNATRVLRAKKIHASNHYFPLHVLFGGVCPAAEAAALRILNLWVSDDAGDDMVSKGIEALTTEGASHG